MAYEFPESVKEFVTLVSDHTFTVDDGVPLKGVDVNNEDNPSIDDVAVTVRWVDEEAEFEESFTFRAIEQAASDGTVVVVENTEGEKVDFRFYTLNPIEVPTGNFLTLSSPKPR